MTRAHLLRCLGGAAPISAPRPARLARAVPDRPAGDGWPLAGAHAGHHGSMESLAGLLERRAFECRQTPDRALQDLPEAEAFLRGRGMLTRTADCALPSLYEACHEDPYKPGSPGFATWPATRWPGAAISPAPSTAARTCWYPARWRACSTLSTAPRSSACARPSRAGAGCSITWLRRAIQHRGPASRAPAQAAGAERAAVPAGAL